MIQPDIPIGNAGIPNGGLTYRATTPSPVTIFFTNFSEVIVAQLHTVCLQFLSVDCRVGLNGSACDTRITMTEELLIIKQSSESSSETLGNLF